VVKKYIVRLSQEERDQLTETVKNLKGGSQKARQKLKSIYPKIEC